MSGSLFWVFLCFGVCSAKSLVERNVITAADIERLMADPTIPHSELKIQSWIPENFRNSSEFQTPRFNFEYMMGEYMTVGEPPAQYLMALETAVPNAFLFHRTWDGQGSKRYDEVRSSTARDLRKAFKSKSGGVECSGKTIEDKFKGPGSLSTFRQQFGAVTTMRYPGGFPKDGVFGLGWNPKEGLQSVPVVNLMKSQHLKVPTQYTLSVRTGNAGVVFYGHLFHAKKLPVVPFRDAAAVAINGFSMGDYSDSVKNWAFIDSGTAVIEIPNAEYRIFAKTVKFEFDAKLGVFVTDCGEGVAQPPAMEFKIGGESYEVTSKEYLIDQNFPNNKCVVAVQQQSENFYSLGLPFLRTVGVVVDLKNKTIGLPKVVTH